MGDSGDVRRHGAEGTDRFVGEGLTFDDVSLVPAYSDVLPGQAELGCRFVRTVALNVPFAAAAMDTVSGSRLAIAIAREGGISVIHRNLSVEDQAAEVRRVKDCRADGRSAAATDDLGRLRVAAAVGTGADREARTQALLDAGVDVVCVDTAHGHSRKVLDAVADTRRNWPDARILAGNIATAEAARALIDVGADGLKVGIGPGSICTTRVVAGVGVPQVTAILDVARAAAGSGIPVVADGGIRYSGEVVKALAAGAETVMMGGLFAGTDEAPGERILLQGRAYKVYRGMGSIGAMLGGSADRYSQEDAAAGGQKLVPEGIEGRVPYKGCLSEVVHQLAGGLRAGMGYLGCRTLDELRARPRFVRMTAAGLRESHVHDVVITQEAPNYPQG